ncbi:DUF5706 domain-containing protein [Nonomuraea sp. 3-1Str]|uniref:Pycsar system effector family protein n=1 Tax=Nonomuraea sp. 3-1Str TaxID=2929801 RepID=UPI00285F8A2B|nr:Pycsar system effector family protein [Nonomuraea sp. 3-1Str]MDR8415078.1 DUF5706 domain-containing protein [Nonomuraea sp. 3-1Str]
MTHTRSRPSTPSVPVGEVTVSGDELLAVLHREGDAARAELARVDAKANMLLAFALGALTAVAAALITAGPRLSVAEVAGVLLATLPLTGAAGVLLTVVRPRIPRVGGTGFVAHARTSGGQELLAAVATAQPEARAADDLHRLSRIALAKYTLVRLAVDLMLVALVALVITLPLAFG